MLSEKESHRNPPHAFESSFSDTLSRDFTNGDKPPLFLQVWFIAVVLFLSGKTLEGVQEMVGGLRKGETALPGSEWPFIKGGLLFFVFLELILNPIKFWNFSYVDLRHLN